MERFTTLAEGLPQVCRLGLATRGNSRLTASDVRAAVERGVNYLNWCGKADGLSRAVAEMGARRKDVVVAAQFQARGAAQAEREMDSLLRTLRTDFLDVATLYYVESETEWRNLLGPGGAWSVLARRKQAGELRLIGLTSHQRKLAAGWAGSGKLDLLMIRYNAAHRGAEQDVFPITRQRKLPVVTFTGQRWRALTKPTPEDPPGFTPAPAPEWYRFCLASPDVAVALMAPARLEELEQDLALLDDWRPPSAAERQALKEHGDRVRRHAGVFW